MNRKELSELRSHFDPDAKNFTMERVLTAFVDLQRDVHGMNLRAVPDIHTDECRLLYDSMKKVLHLGLGRQSTELPFRNHAYAEDGIQTMLSKLISTDLKDESLAADFLAKLAQCASPEFSFAVILGLCRYDPPRKNKMGENDEEGSDRVFRYIVAALCPVAKTDGVLVYDPSGEEISRQDQSGAVLSKAPAEGFLYPVFTDRSADVHHILYYTKTPNSPHETLISDVLECEPETPADSDHEGMRKVLGELLGDSLTYETVTDVNEQLTQIAAKNRTDEEPTEITGQMLHRMLAKAGVPEEQLTETERVFDAHVESGLKPERLTASRTTLKTPEISVTVKNEAKDKVRLGTVGGKQCMIIELDDACVQVNGYDLKVPGQED